jgi:hypothetical protein
MGSMTRFARAVWFAFTLLLLLTASPVRAQTVSPTTQAPGLKLHANLYGGSDMLGAVYDPIEARVFQTASQYGALVPLIHAMQNGALEQALPTDVSSDALAEAAINSAIDTSLSRLSSAQSWDDVVHGIVSDARFDGDLKALVEAAARGATSSRELNLTLYYDRAWMRARVMGTVSAIMARDLLPGRPFINRWWHMARTGSCPRGPIRRAICNRLHDRIWGAVNAEVDKAIARIEAQLASEIEARIAKLEAKNVKLAFSGIRAWNLARPGSGGSGAELFLWDAPKNEWNRVVSATLGAVPSEIVRQTVERVLDQHAPRHAAPAPCETRQAPPR